MNGETVPIAGSTDGLGRHLAVRLGAAGARVLVHGRDAFRAELVRSQILAAGGLVLLADLGQPPGRIPARPVAAAAAAVLEH
ncbi:hypothetical protein WEI85_27055 [Actinomycetes bacterium KLBMP 9797]